MARRGNKEGSIYKRPDGRWCAQVSVNGRRLTKYGKTRAEVHGWLTNTLSKEQQGLLIDTGRLTVAEWLERWLQDAKPSLRPRTYLRYAEIVRLHLVPRLGELRLSALQPAHLQQLYGEKIGDGLSARSVQRIHNVAHRALKIALQFGLVARNVADAVVPPRPQQAEVRALESGEIGRLLSTAQGDRLYPLVLLAIASGARQGEILALRWGDLDWQSGSLSITRAVQPIKGQGSVVMEPKTKAGRRSVTLPPIVLDALLEHYLQQREGRERAGESWQDLDLIFPSGKGTHISPGNLWRRFNAICKRAGLDDVHFHCLRHTAASALLTEGTNPKVVAEMLGHTRVELTLNVYSHVVPSLQRQAAEAMGKVLARELQ